jgi:transcription elongation factor Elf1
MQAFATDIAVYIACPSCSQTGLVDQSTLSAARMRRAQVTLTCHACGERFDATEAQEVILAHVPQETLDMPLTARSTIDVEAETEEPEPRYARASDHEPLTRYQSLHDVWQHLGAETDEDGDDDIVPTLPSWLQKKDNGQGENGQGESENAETETPSKEAEANVSVAADADTSPEPNTNNETGDETDNEAGSGTPATPSDAATDDLAGLAGKLSKPDIDDQTDDRILDLTSVEQHLPALPEVGAIEEELEKQDSAARLNWPLAIFGAMVVIFGLLAGVLYF